MQSESADSLIPIGQVVARLRVNFPGVTHSSLRFLEREGLVVPSRTSGGHRLYRQGDLDRIGKIKEWQAQRVSLAEIRERLVQSDTAENRFGDEFMTAVLESDLSRAASIVHRIDEFGMPLDRIFRAVLQPALVEIGTRWSLGTAPVGQEKEISELARELIAELSQRHAHPNPTGPVVVAACVSGERHDLGLRMVVALLRERGWQVHFLGADVAPTYLEERVRTWQPHLILLSATQSERLVDLTEAVNALRAVSSHGNVPTVLIGGQLASKHTDAIRSLGVIPVADCDLDAVLAFGQDPDLPVPPPFRPSVRSLPARDGL